MKNKYFILICLLQLLIQHPSCKSVHNSNNYDENPIFIQRNVKEEKEIRHSIIVTAKSGQTDHPIPEQIDHPLSSPKVYHNVWQNFCNSLFA
jgi:hypothetical protein